MKSRRSSAVLIAGPIMAALLVALLSSCSDEGSPVDLGGGDPPDSVSYAQQVQPIFDARCTGCHGAGGNGGLDLRSPESYDNLVGLMSPNYSALRVSAGMPSGSVLFDKISGGGVYGDRMPLGQTPLTDPQIAMIRAWIEQGALRN